MGWHTLPYHEGTTGWNQPEGAHSCFITTYSANYQFPRAGGVSPSLYLQCDPVFVTGIQVSASWGTSVLCNRFFWTVWVNGGLVYDDVELLPEWPATYLDVPFSGILSTVTLVFRSESCVWPALRGVWVGCARGYVPGVTANFEAEPLTGYAPLAVQFTDLSTLQHPSGPPIVSWTWAFGDGVGSYEQNPTHTYTECPNEYDVQLIVSNGYQSDTELKTDYITTYCAAVPRTYFLLA